MSSINARHSTSKALTFHNFSMSERWGQIREALDYINPDCGYDLWLRIGMAIHSEFSDGFPLWDNWSKRGRKYPKEKDKKLREHWRSFKARSGVTLGTLFREARLGGWEGQLRSDYTSSVEPPAEEIANSPAVGPAQAITDDDEVYEYIEFPYDFSSYEGINISHFPEGLINNLFQHFLKCSASDVTSYAFAAAIAWGGFQKRNYCQTETKLRTNFMCQVVGPSGSGKSQVVNTIKDIAEFYKIERFIAEGIGSMQGIYKFLTDPQKDSSLFQLLDESEFDLDDSQDKNVPSHVRQINKFKLDVFSPTAFITMRITQDRPAFKIYNPFFSELALSTPNILPKLRTLNLKGGLFARQIFFLGNDDRRKRNNFVLPPITKKLDDSIIFYQSLIKGDRKTATFSPEAQSLLERWETLMDDYSQVAQKKGDQFESIFNRGAEMVKKLALLFLEPEHNLVIPEEFVQLAIGIWIQSTKILYEFAQNYMSSNLTEAMFKDIKRKIKEMGPESDYEDNWILFRDLSRRFIKYKPKEIWETVIRLGQEGWIDIKQNGNNKKSYFLRSRKYDKPKLDLNSPNNPNKKRKTTK